MTRIQPLSQADAQAYRAFLQHVAPADLSRRVMGGLAAVPDSAIADLLEPNGRFGTGYAARLEESGDIVGVVRLAPTKQATEREVAILVRSESKRRGIGRDLLAHAIALAKAGKCTALTAVTASDNQGFIGLARQFGFSAHWDANERATMLRLELLPADR